VVGSYQGCSEALHGLAVGVRLRLPPRLVPQRGTMTDTLTALLRRAGLERLLPRFEEEDLTIPLLISMGTQLRANLEDMALSPDEIEAVAEALLYRADGAEPSANEAGPSGCCSGLVLEAGVATVSPDPLASFRQAVAELQAELYADDLEPPADAHAWSAEQLRTYYESGGESTPCGPPGPSLRTGILTGAIAEDLGACRGSQLRDGIEAEEEPVVIAGQVVGTLHLRWQTHRADFDFAADTTVRALKRWLQP
jgi:hypothetical protein